MAVSIIIADEFPAVRGGVRTWLEEHPEFEVRGEASGAAEALRLVKRHQPDVLITALRLPGLSGPDVVELTHKQSPRTRGVIYSRFPQQEHLVEALRKGALAYVLQSSSPDVLLRAVRAAAGGSYFLDPACADQPLDVYLQRCRAQPPDPLDVLSPREKEVLYFVCRGHANADIARRLHLSPRTVEQHRAYMMRKLHLRNRIDLIYFALRRGIVSLED